MAILKISKQKTRPFFQCSKQKRKQYGQLLHLPKTNMSPKKGSIQKERTIFQPLLFQGTTLSFRWSKLRESTRWALYDPYKKGVVTPKWSCKWVTGGYFTPKSLELWAPVFGADPSYTIPHDSTPWAHPSTERT